MKLLSSSLIFSGILTLLVSGCKPQGVEPERLRDTLAQNQELRQQLADKKIIIQRSGAFDNTLNDRIAALDMQLATAVRQGTQLQREELELQARLTELKQRLEDFNDDFETLKQKVSTSPIN